MIRTEVGILPDGSLLLFASNKRGFLATLHEIRVRIRDDILSSFFDRSLPRASQPVWFQSTIGRLETKAGVRKAFHRVHHPPASHRLQLDPKEVELSLIMYNDAKAIGKPTRRTNY